MSVKSIITSVSADPSIPYSPAVGNYYKVYLADGQCLSLCDEDLFSQFWVWKAVCFEDADPAVLIGLELDLSQLMPA